eukprot:SAG31_NODE_33970_length_338_cov_0.828452_1_plen_24_part_10
MRAGNEAALVLVLADEAVNFAQQH